MKALAALVLAAVLPPVGKPDFASQVLPHLTKAGCNQGTCHGAAVGRGGFKLSLLGDDPASDFDAIVREFGGRRVRLDQPEASLLLQKATGGLGHGGGVRLAPGSLGYKALAVWLAAGAPYGESQPLVRLTVTPSEALLPMGSRVPLTVVAVAADGAQTDATPLALYDTLNEGIITVDRAGVATLRASGVGAVMVRFRGQVAAVRLGSPFPGTRPPVATYTNPLDQALFEELARLNIRPKPRCDDATFLRRVQLDLTGTLPTPNEARAFLKAPDRAKLVDSLLQRSEFVELWTLTFADLLRLSAKRFGPGEAAAYHAWLKAQVAQNTPLNTLVSDLLTQRESFWRTQSDPRDLAEFFSRTWLGTRVECARCHNHPYDRWTRNDYYAFAAAFARPGQVPHPKTGKPVTAQALGDPKPLASRTALAAWASHSPRLADALANRLWKALFGQGLVEPVDDLRPANPATYPRVLSTLASELTKTGYDLRATLRLLVLSEAYQQVAGGRALRAQVLADALVAATGSSLGLPGRAISLPDPEVPSATLDILGRCKRDSDCTPSTESGGLAQALHLMAGEPLEKLVQEGATQLTAAHPTNPALVEELYLRTLSRFPTAAERAFAEKRLTGDRRRATEDLLWALVNTREFAYNH